MSAQNTPKPKFPYSVATDSNGDALSLYHGTNDEFSEFDVSKTVDGGIHFGEIDQALMRSAGAKKYLIQVELNVKKPRRSKDDGGNWSSKIRSAKNLGFDSIIYLNRFEGIKQESLVSSTKQAKDIDRLTDIEFRKHFPEARDSWIVFEKHQIHIVSKECRETNLTTKQTIKSKLKP